MNLRIFQSVAQKVGHEQGQVKVLESFFFFLFFLSGLSSQLIDLGIVWTASHVVEAICLRELSYSSDAYCGPLSMTTPCEIPFFRASMMQCELVLVNLMTFENKNSNQ